MTPEERKLVTDLFDRLASLESAPRDPTAERAIIEGLRQAPNAVYSLVQTVLVQDEALKRADAHIRELESGAEQASQNTSFLGGARGGSVPPVRPAGVGGGISSAWRNTGAPAAPGQAPPAAQPGQFAPQAAPQPNQYAPQAAPQPMPQGGSGGGGSSFLGTAAAAAAGMVGGSLLMGGIRSMMGGSGGGHGGHSAFGSPGSGAPRDSAPWGGGGSGGTGDLARQAGIDDMGKTPRSAASQDAAGGGGGAGRGGAPEDEDTQYASDAESDDETADDDTAGDSDYETDDDADDMGDDGDFDGGDSANDE